MARSRGRLSGLLKEYRSLAGGTPTAGSRLGGFEEWLKGQRSVEVTNAIPPGAKRLFPLSIYAFGRDYDVINPAITAVKTKASAYTLSGIARIGGTFDTVLGHNLPTADADAATFEEGFYPALAKVSMTAAGATETNRRSGITNQLYPYTYRRTFGCPFGRVVANPEEDYVERMAAITAALGPITGFISVSFEPEIWRKQGTSAAFDPATDGVTVT